MQPISVNTVKIRNRATVFQEILSAGSITRQELARRCGLSLGTVASIVDELGRQRVVIETKDVRTSVGRKPNLVKIIGTVRRVLAIDLASRNFVYELLGIDLTESVQGVHQFNESLTFEQNIRVMLDEIKQLMADSHIMAEELIGVGLSVPGSYRYAADRVDNALFPELHSIRLNALIAESFSVPIMIEHDVFLAVRAEIGHLEEYRDKNVFFVFLGEGIGGALAIRGEVYRGSREDAGDIGRLLVNETDTLEELVSWRRTRAILSIDSAGRDSPLADWAYELDKDSTQRAHLKSIAGHVARALYNVFWTVDPDTFIIGGEYQALGVRFLQSVQSHLRDLLGAAQMTNLDMTLSRHGIRAGRIGAGEMVREYWLDNL